MCLGSFMFVWFVPVCPGSGLFGRSGAPWWSLGSMHLLCPVATLGSLVSFGFVWFVRVLHGCRWVLLRTSGSSRCALGVARFVGIRLVRQDAPWFRSRSFAREPWGSLGSFGFISVCLGFAGLFRMDRFGALRVARLSGCGLGVAVFFWVRLVRLGAPWVSLCYVALVLYVWVRALGVDRFVYIRQNAPWGALG